LRTVFIDYSMIKIIIKSDDHRSDQSILNPKEALLPPLAT